MLQANTTPQMATDHNKWWSTEKYEMPAKCPPDGDREKLTCLDTCRMNNSGLKSGEDQTKSGSTTSMNGARWTCTQQAFWRNQELNGGSLWNAWLTATDTEPMDRWIDGLFSRDYNPWSKPERLEVRLPIRPAMKSEAINDKNRYSLTRVPNYF